MKKITSVTTFRTEFGNMLAYTYTEIDDSGNIIKRNTKGNRAVVDEEIDAHIEALKTFAQSIVDGEE